MNAPDFNETPKVVGWYQALANWVETKKRLTPIFQGADDPLLLDIEARITWFRQAIEKEIMPVVKGQLH